MTVLPPQNIPALLQRYTGVTPPAALMILASRKVGFGPEATEGSAIPDSKIMPYSGIYDENGHLPNIPGAGITFLAYA